MNSLKHGLTGNGVVLAEPDAREVAAQIEVMGAVAEARPMLARRVAVLAQRLERLAVHDEAALAVRVREAEVARDAAREHNVDALIARLKADPVAAARDLRTTPEGCDRLIDLWTDLVRCRKLGMTWNMNHVERAELLCGHDPLRLLPSDWRMLTHVAWGRTRLTNGPLPSSDPRDPAAIQAEQDAANAEIDDRLDAEILGLRDLRDRLLGNLDAEARRSEAEALALFDTSPQAALLRRYEMATERGLYRALRELEQTAPAFVEDSETHTGMTPTTEPAEPLASFGTMETAVLISTVPNVPASLLAANLGDLPQSIGGQHHFAAPPTEFGQPQRIIPAG